MVLKSKICNKYHDFKVVWEGGKWVKACWKAYSEQGRSYRYRTITCWNKLFKEM